MMLRYSFGQAEEADLVEARLQMRLHLASALAILWRQIASRLAQLA